MVTNLQILGVGQSDHLGTFVIKKSREIRACPRTTKKRVYKNFIAKDFIQDIKHAKELGVFNLMHETNDIEVAGDVFTNTYNEVLDRHAPIKVIQNRSNYVPYITKELEILMKE